MHGRPGDLLEDICSRAQSIFIAAPYIKADTLSRVLDRIDARPSLICVTRWSAQDLAAGVSDAECRTIVKEFGGSFRLHPSLHAKYYRIDDAVLIGSANLTSAGMGWSSQSNLEILCLAGDDFDAPSFEQQLLRDAREVGDEEFRRWGAIVEINRRIENTIAGSQPRLDTWRPTTRDPSHLELSYQGRADEIASFDERAAARRDIESLLFPPGLSEEDVRAWASTCLLAAPFTNSVIRLHGSADMQGVYRLLAQEYGLSLTEARRDMEAVQGWLAFFVPEVLQGS